MYRLMSSSNLSTLVILICALVAASQQSGCDVYESNEPIRSLVYLRARTISDVSVENHETQATHCNENQIKLVERVARR